MIHFSDDKLTCMRRILSGAYHRSLKWAYTSAWASNDPGSCIPQFHEDVISCKLYPISKDSIVFTWIIWTIFMSMIQQTQLPLPKVNKNLPVIMQDGIVLRGGLMKDEMTCY
jgi:hypothetical protein